MAKRKMHPNSLANLKPVRTSEEARERGAKGNAKKQENDGKRKKTREFIEELLKAKVTNKKQKDLLKEFGFSEQDHTFGALLVCTQAVQGVIKGDTNAAKLLLGIIGDLEPIDENEGTKPEININILAATPADIDED